MTTSILSTQPGKYRPRKDWSTNSIPTLVSLEEETSPNDEDDKNDEIHRLPIKPPRRSSLAVGITSGSGGGGGLRPNIEQKINKRRSSIAVAFLGRHNKSKESPYEVAVISEKCDTRNNNNNNNNGSNSGSATWYETSDESNNEQTPYDNDNLNISTKSDGSILDKDKTRRTSWRPKVDRRRRSFASTLVNDDSGNNNDIGIPPPSPPNGSSSPYNNHRQKRHSWWNIFVPDNLKQRSRRASTQDGIVGVDVLARNVDSFAPRQFRSKSRSVDHGLAAPFDLESLKSKVEGRFDSVERLSKDGRQRGSMPTIPTKSYTVGNRDTLTSVAARFDTTPSELTSINKLNSSFIYPGQQLLVPDKTSIKDSGEDGGSGCDGTSTSGKSSPIDGKYRKSSNDDVTLEEKELLEGLRPGSPKPGHIERVSSPYPVNDDDPVITQRFLKINVRHITDGQGVVAGVLLVTPNAVMFDPNVSDPLVIEHGPESYGVIAPMELVVNAAIFHDIAHMRVGGESNTSEKVEIYYPKQYRCETSHSPGKDSLLVKDETFPELGIGSVECCDDQESVCSSNERDGDAFPKAFERDLVTPTNLQKAHAAAESQESAGSTERPNNNSTESTNTVATTTTSIEDIDTKENNKANTDNINNNNNNENTDLGKELRSLEERRRSLLDHHWAVPSKESRSVDDDNSEINNEIAVATSNDTETPNNKTNNTISNINNNNIDNNNNNANINTNNNNNNNISIDINQLEKLSCHDSGIDIRDPNVSNVQAIPAKKNYSDADIVLSSDWAPPLTIAATDYTDSPPKSQYGNMLNAAQVAAQAHNVDSGGRKKTSSVSFSIDDNSEQHSLSTSSDKSSIGIGAAATSNDKKQSKMLKRLSYPLTWVEGLTGDGKPSNELSGSGTGSGDSAPNTGDSNQSVFSKVFSSSPITLVSEIGGNLFLSKTPSEDSGGSPVPPINPNDHGHGAISGRSSIGTFIRPNQSTSSDSGTKPSKAPPPKLDYRSMVSIDDMPELFVSFDKLIPRPARACNDPPLYLRLRMGRPIGKTMPLPTSVMSYGKNKLRPEFWFSVPKNRTDELYRFLISWVPHLYGELDEEQITSRGFELIQHDTEWVKGAAMKDGRLGSDGEDISEYTRESWEVLSMSTDEYHKASVFNSASFEDFVIPDLIGTTEILTEDHREKLCGHLPARAEGYSWSLIFSTLQHGFSLNTLYRKMYKLESPILLVIEDTDNCVFGALTSCSLRVSDLFYGTGESLLYKFNPNFKVFHWTGENLYFIKGNPESLSIGAGDGRFGLWLDGDLNQGRSQRCSTYANDPLAHQEDFVVKTLECWAFV